MSEGGAKTAKVAVGITIVTLIAILAFVSWNYASLKIRVAFAAEQTGIFSEMRAKAFAGNAAEAASALQYVVWYYPSGTKQQTGSRLDTIVEGARAQAIRDIITYLRSKTHEDFGTNAEPWIQKYAKH